MPREKGKPVLDPAQVSELQRKYSGLDDELEYISGHTIYTKYKSYKEADKQSGDASAAYTSAAKSLRATKPYADPPATGPVKGGYYYRDGHQKLAPLAGTASSTAS